MNNLLLEVFLLGAIALIAWLCYLKPETRFGKWFVMIVVALSGGMSVLAGLLFALYWMMSTGRLPVEMPSTVEMPAISHVDFMAILSIAMGVVAVPVLIRPVRKLLSTTLFPGLDPDLPVHTWALYIYLLALMMTLSMVTVMYDPQLFIDSIRETPIFLSVVFNLVIFTLLAFACNGVFIRQDFKATLQNLGLTKIDRAILPNLIALGLLLTVLTQVLEWLITPFIPSTLLHQIQEIMGTMQSFHGVQETLIASVIIGVCAGVGEEILFRGLIQPVFGLIPTSILFTLIHVHYGPTVLLLDLFIVGVTLGWVRQRYNTTASIVAHASFDIFAVASSLVLQYLHY